MAVALHGQGKLAEAERYYRQILSADPNNADALHLFGVLMQQRGQTATAIDLIRRAIEINPKVPAFRSNLSKIYRQMGQPAAAVEQLRVLCALEPGSAEPRTQLGYILLGEFDQIPEAIELLRAAVAIDPKSVAALSALALAIHRQNNPAGALPIYEQAIALAPRDTSLLSNYSAALLETGQSDRALEMYENALKIEPDSALVWYNLGVAQMSLEQNDRAKISFEKTMELDPAHPMAKVNLAAVLKAQGFLEESARMFEALIAKHPEWGPLHSNLGLARLNQGRHDEAFAAMRKAVVLDPGRANVWSNLLFSLHYHAGYDAAQIYQEHRIWAEPLEKNLAGCTFPNDRNPDRRLRVGYVSPDFREHSVSFFIEPILERHNRSAFEVFCYANHPSGDATAVRLRGLADKWQPIYSRSDEAVAEMIQRDQIDILMDLASHTTGNRLTLFAKKPAPLQGTYLGYASTTGLRAIDFRFTDDWVDPPGESEAYHTEQLVRLPHTQWVYRPPIGVPEVAQLPAEKNSHITFGVATNLAKINHETIDMWRQVLKAVANSTLIIKGAGTEDPATQQRIHSLFAEAGINPERIRFEPSVPLLEYFNFFSRVDIILDTYPFAGGTTSCHALYMGTPTVTRTGNTSVSRVGASLLHNVCLPELIADSPEKFAQIAVELANDRDGLAKIRASLRSRMKQSPLMNEVTFVKNLESSYRMLWTKAIGMK